MATERTVKIKVEADGTAINDLLQEIDQLKDKIKTASDPKVVKKLNDEFEETTRKLKDVEKATKGITLDKTFDEIYGGILPLSGRLGELEDRMYELALAGKADTQEFKDMNEKAAKYRTTIKDVDRQVDMLADNKGMSVFSAGADEVGSSLLRMDFETAALQAKSLAMASGKISFKSAIKSVKAMGSTFASLGKALLTNPFFLIVGVVAAIVGAIVALMDELGILQKIFDAVGDAIGWVIQQFKDLLDWMGLTDYAGEDYAQKQIDRNEKLVKSYDDKTKEVVAGMDHEIQMAEAQGKSTEKLEREKLLLLNEAASKRIQLANDTAEHLIKVHGKDSEEYKEQIEAIRLLTAEAKQAARDVELFDTQQIAADKKKREESLQSELEAKTEAANKWRDKQEQMAEAQLSADRMIEQANIELIENDLERGRQMNVFKQEQAFNDINRELLTNEQIEALAIQHQTKLQLIQEEFDAQKEAKAQALRDKKIESDLAEEQIAIAAVEKLEAQNERIRELRASDLENKISSIKSEYAIQLDAAKGNADLIVELEKAKANEIKEIRDQALREEIQNQRAAVNFAVDQTGALFAQMGGLAEEGSAASKAFALASIIADTASALMKAVPVALEAAKATGPAAPFIFAGTLAGIIGTVVGAAANAKKALTSGGGGGGGVSGGGSAVSAGSAPNVGSPQQTPEVSPFNENENTDQNAGGSVNRKVMVVDYFDIKDKGNEVNGLQNRVKLA